ncbi:hypothetical protein MAR_022158 [Mya arenaria]|uniref:Uncharacterized protein n=1 Tax=Mya arenaria TaxID=6604 RepID=A0ABY7DM73_MYAAR|nr:hypothetical protein MAR_022158 [Mya arenaria]
MYCDKVVNGSLPTAFSAAISCPPLNSYRPLEAHGSYHQQAGNTSLFLHTGGKKGSPGRGGTPSALNSSRPLGKSFSRMVIVDAELVGSILAPLVLVLPPTPSSVLVLKHTFDLSPASNTICPVYSTKSSAAMTACEPIIWYTAHVTITLPSSPRCLATVHMTLADSVIVRMAELSTSDTVAPPFPWSSLMVNTSLLSSSVSCTAATSILPSLWPSIYVAYPDIEVDGARFMGHDHMMPQRVFDVPHKHLQFNVNVLPTRVTAEGDTMCPGSRPSESWYDHEGRGNGSQKQEVIHRTKINLIPRGQGPADLDSSKLTHCPSHWYRGNLINSTLALICGREFEMKLFYN